MRSRVADVAGDRPSVQIGDEGAPDEGEVAPVEIGNWTVEGTTRMSTVLHVGGFVEEQLGEAGSWSDDRLVVFGTTGLQAGDFRDFSAWAEVPPTA